MEPSTRMTLDYFQIEGYYGAKYSYDSCPALQMDLEDTKAVLENMRKGVLGKNKDKQFLPYLHQVHFLLIGIKTTK